MDPWLQAYIPRERPGLDAFLMGTHCPSSPIRLLPKDILQYIFSFLRRGRRRGLYNPTSQGVLLKILLLGDSMVGKTSILNQYVMHKFVSFYKATIGADFLTTQKKFLEQDCVLQIWDTAGQERFAGLHSAFYRGTDAVMVVFDLTRRSSFDQIDYWLGGFRTHCPNTEAIVVVGNKCDLKGKEEVSESEARDFCAARKISYFEVSAKNNEGLDAAFQELVEYALECFDVDQYLADAAAMFKTAYPEEEGCQC